MLFRGNVGEASLLSSTTKKCDPRKTIRCLPALQLFPLFFWKSPELKLGDELNTDGTDKPNQQGFSHVSELN